MTERVIDASVLLAIAKSERYEAGLISKIEGAVMSAVNYAEVLSRLSDLQIDPSTPAIKQIFDLLDRVESFSATQAQMVGALRIPTSSAGLSLGDRACLALAIELGADVYTADRQWSAINIGRPIHLIR